MKRTTLLIFAPLLAGACTAAGYAPATPAPASTLTDTRWTFTAIDGQPPLSERAGIQFDGDRIGATVGCNGMGGTWRLENGRLMGGPYMSTKMWCEDLMDQEQALGALLGENPQVTLEGDTLILQGDTRRAELRRAE